MLIIKCNNNNNDDDGFLWLTSLGKKVIFSGTCNQNKGSNIDDKKISGIRLSQTG